MLEGDEWKREPPEEETPMARMHREQLEHEEADAKASDDLIASLTPADAHTPLIPYSEVMRWGLKRKRKK